MPSKTTIARHRAAASINPLVAISQAVASNAGSFGRQAAVVAVATGLAVSVGVPAMAAGTNVDSQAPTETSVSSVQRSASFTSVSANEAAKISFEKAAATTTEATVTVVKAQPEAKASAAPKAEQPAAAPAAPAAKTEAPSAPSAGLGAVAAAAYSGIGVAYVWGGTTPAGWDCSGFVKWAYAQAGINLPRTNQWGVMVPTSNPKPGDLVVQNGGSHVGIYVGNGMEVSALNPSQGTLLTPVSAVGSSAFYTMP